MGEATRRVRLRGPNDERRTTGETTIQIRNRRALVAALRAPLTSGPVRAYAQGDVEILGDLDTAVGSETIVSKTALLVDLLRCLPSTIRTAPTSAQLPLGGLEFKKPRSWTIESYMSATQHHYDLASRFFEIMLGPSMTYSSGIWERGDSLDDAQERKLERVIRQLRPVAGQHFLDIGCGFGVLIQRVQNMGLTSTGLTHSKVQAAWAVQHFSGADVRVADIFDAKLDPVDRIASVGMYEHVPEEWSPRYFARLASLLKPAGRILQQQIVRDPGHGARLKKGGFTERFIFPNGQLKTIETIRKDAAAAGLLAADECEFGHSYALTLRAWLSNIESKRAEVEALIGSARLRLWRLYLLGTAHRFERGDISVIQITFAR